MLNVLSSFPPDKLREVERDKQWERMKLRERERERERVGGGCRQEDTEGWRESKKEKESDRTCEERVKTNKIRKKTVK